MVKKISHIIIAFILLISVSGVSFSLHYCGGELISTAINHKVKSCCDGTGGCCENKIIHFQLKDDFVNSPQIESNSIAELDILQPIDFDLICDNLPRINIISFEIIDTSPPPIQQRLSLLQAYLC